ncbi:MAG: Alpha-rhamnosidase, partial [Verrucomicrobiales bacterium]|nr:Alpha-rhamnosidase [Verrucomicrobiales bacterium]
MTRVRAFILFCAIVATSSSITAASVTRLRCEYLENPIGIDTTQPRLSWNIESKERGYAQTAYRILVATEKSKLLEGKADLWDSGRVESDQCINVLYGGKTLQSGEQCYWAVRVWDIARGDTFSKPAMWQMGLLSSNDWHGKWIARTTDTNSKPAPFLRRSFKVKQPVKRATAYICGLGYYELHVNGKKIGDHLLDPGYTRYDKRDLYVTYDVTDDIQRGKNAIGVILGNGWFNVQTRAVWEFDKAPWRAAPKLLMELRIELADGTVQNVVSDETWKTSAGPITFNSIYGGENYDARLEMPGWDAPNFHDSKWAHAQAVDAPKGKLVAQKMPPIKATEEFAPKNIVEPKPGIYVIDFGQNMAGFVQLTLSAPAGTEIKMKYGERTNDQGFVDQTIISEHVRRMDSNQQFQVDSYIAKGKGSEQWHSRFTYHGFQYIEVTGLPTKPTDKNFRAYFIHSAVPVAGTFKSSNDLFNRIWTAGRYS